MDRHGKINHRILRLKEVVYRTGRSRSTIYEDMRAGRFPKSILLGSRSVGWLESEIDAWIVSCLASRT